MSTETMIANEPLVKEENNSIPNYNDPSEGSSTNGTFHNEGMNFKGEQGEPNKEAYENDQEEKYDKSELEAESLRKVFIGGLSYKTEDDAFREYFSKFGDIVDCIIMRDRDGRSRGFGFVTYASSAMVDRLMAGRPHILDAREIEPKRAVPREESGKPESSLSAKKLFVGGIREGAVNENDMKEYFCKYGNIVDAVIMKTNEGKLRGFGFVEFDDYDPVDKIVLEKHHVIKGNPVNVEKALPKDQTNRARMAASNYAGGGRGGGGMRGPPSRSGGGWGPMGGESQYGGDGGYRSGGGGGYGGGGMGYGNRPDPYGGGYSSDMGGGGNSNMMGFGGSAPMGGGGGGYGMGGPNRGGYDDGFGAFGGSGGYGFGQNYGSSSGGGPMRRADDGGGGMGGGRGGAPYGGRGGGGRGAGGGFRGRN